MEKSIRLIVYNSIPLPSSLSPPISGQKSDLSFCRTRSLAIRRENRKTLDLGSWNWLEDKDTGTRKGITRREKSLTSQFGAKWLASEGKWSKGGKKVADDCVKIRLSSKEERLVFFIASCKCFFFFSCQRCFDERVLCILKRPRISSWKCQRKERWR